MNPDRCKHELQGRRNCESGDAECVEDKSVLETSTDKMAKFPDRSCCWSRGVVIDHNQLSATETRVMENNPPPSVSPMHPRPHSKSSPAKRDTTRVLTPQLNQASAPSDDVFHTGLLTPHASQNAGEMDAAKSLISPPPEGGAQAGTSRQHVCFTFESGFSHNNLGLTLSTS